VPDDVDGCIAVLAALPEYFTPSTHDEIRRDVPLRPAWVAVQDDVIIGFVLAPRRYSRAAEITHAAVLPDLRNQGMGTLLLNHALTSMTADGIVMAEVKTLDATSGYEPYVATRAFWERRGFIQIDCIDPLPGWDPGNPSAIYAKALTAPSPA
jgi:ribosomal protein S18 acetylase RimI-like enzyme